MALKYTAHGERETAQLTFINRSKSRATKKKYPLWPDDNMTIGRDPGLNEHTISSPEVSRRQLEFYTVCFDPEDHPMVYVRDRQSSNGTFVNGKLVGKGPLVTPGYLLKKGDVVTVGNEPKAKFSFEVDMDPITTQTLTPLQLEEAKQFQNKYTITNIVLGHGGSGSVHLAYDVKTGKQLACKVRDLANEDPRDVAKLMQGLQLSMDLKHPNVASFTCAAKSKHTLFVFEELATGGDLFSLIYRRTRFEEHEIQWMLSQVLKGVEYLHNQDIVHKDIKSENVLAMTCPESCHRLALTDFGHASKVGVKRAAVGTRGWQAPEVLQADAYHGKPIDMWSIGILAVYMLCGYKEVQSLDALEDALRDDPYLKDINLDGIYKEINSSRNESADNHQVREHFIARCLNVNQKNRVSAEAALTHPWLNGTAEQVRKHRARHEKNKTSWKPQQAKQKQPILRLYDVEEAEKRRTEILARLKEKVAEDTFGPLPVPSKKRTADFSFDTEVVSHYFVNNNKDPNQKQPDPYPGMTSHDGKTKSPSQFCKDMNPHERRREFGGKGRTYSGLAKPIDLKKHFTRSAAELKAHQEMDDLRDEIRQEEWEMQQKKRAKEIYDSNGDAWDASPSRKKRKVA